MKIVTYIVITTLLLSCSSKKEMSLFQNDKGEYIDIQFYKENVIPGIESIKPYTQYTITLNPAVKGHFEVRNKRDNSLQIYQRIKSESSIEMNEITLTNQSQNVDEEGLILVWNNEGEELFTKLPRPTLKTSLPRP